jgi:hypothetical protein
VSLTNKRRKTVSHDSLADLSISKEEDIVLYDSSRVANSWFISAGLLELKDEKFYSTTEASSFSLIFCYFVSKFGLTKTLFLDVLVHAG